MNMLGNLTTDASIEEESDRLGGGFQPLESGLYSLKVKLAYITLSAGKAMALNVKFITEDGKELRQQLWMTSGEVKGCKNFYVKDGKKYYLPGFNAANALALMTTGKEIGTLKTTKKTIPLYNFDAKKEVPTEVDVLMDLTDKDIIGGVLLQKEDKKAKNPQTAEYEPTGETRMVNEIDKFFHFGTGLTVAEAKAKQKDPVFKNKWAEKWTGQVKDNSTNTGAVQGTPSASAPTRTPAATENIFA
jgi:hypothetical protein